MGSDRYKVKLLTVLSVFEQKTDKDHPMSADNIADEAAKRIKIPCNRKGIYDDMSALNDYWFVSNDPRRIEKDEKGRGYYLTNRPFSTGDVKLMVDAIESSKYLSEAKTLKLIEALQKLCPETQVKDMKSQLVVFDRVKSMNTDIHESLSVISSAIAHNRQIRLKYFDYDVNKKRAYRKKGAFYQMSPYELVYTDDNYYLVAYDAVKKKRTTFRVDRMVSVAIVLMDREGQEAFGDNRKEKLKFQKSTFSMFDGKVETVTMRFRINMLNAVIDKFGSDVFITPDDKEHFQISVPVVISQQFYGWVFGLGNYVTIVGPEKIKKEMAKKLEEIRKRYND